MEKLQRRRYSGLPVLLRLTACARRHSRAKQVMRDLIDRRISHARAAQAMRELDSRAKGGWLVKAMRKR